MSADTKTDAERKRIDAQTLEAVRQQVADKLSVSWMGAMCVLRLYDARTAEVEKLRERNAALVAEVRWLNVTPIPAIFAERRICNGIGCNVLVDANGNALPGHKHSGEFCRGEEDLCVT